MAVPAWAVILLIGCLALFSAAVFALILSGRRREARALTRFVPDFVPLVGQLDDAILVVLTLRFVLRGAGPTLLAEHWPGSPDGLRVLTRVAFGPPA